MRWRLSPKTGRPEYHVAWRLTRRCLCGYVAGGSIANTRRKAEERYTRNWPKVGRYAAAHLEHPTGRGPHELRLEATASGRCCVCGFTSPWYDVGDLTDRMPMPGHAMIHDCLLHWWAEAVLDDEPNVPVLDRHVPIQELARLARAACR